MKVLCLLLWLAAISFSYAQSSSVFDASYFNIGEKEPPIRIGKGFHINDPFKQTRFCFTTASIHPKNLVPQQTAAKTQISVYHTRNSQEFKAIKSSGVSGKVSFLNFFSAGGDYLNENYGGSITNTERLVFVMKIDWGRFDYLSDLELTPDAQKLIDEKQFQKFADMYGTHYISGVRKEASIYVVLTKKNSQLSQNKKILGNFSTGLNTPAKHKGSLEVKDASSQESILASDEFTASIEINGASIDKETLESTITELMQSDVPDKANAINKLISKAASNITNSDDAIISQYYFSPFSLYGIENLVWDSKKENQLTNINERVIQAYKAEQALTSFLNGDANQNTIWATLNSIPTVVESPKKHKNLTRTQNDFQTLVEQATPQLQNYQKQVQALLSSLESTYTSCSAIDCRPSAECCVSSVSDAEVKTLLASIEQSYSEIERAADEVMNQAWAAKNAEAEKYQAQQRAREEAQKPDCEKKGTFTISISNLSKNPYNLYWNDQFLYQLGGGETKSWEFYYGVQNFRAEQVSGYLLYPTINYRKITPQSYCQQWTVKVGFED